MTKPVKILSGRVLRDQQSSLLNSLEMAENRIKIGVASRMSSSNTQATTPNPQPSPTASTTPSPKKPEDEKPQKEDNSWLWKWGIPIFLMIIGPVAGLIWGTIGYLFDIAVPIYSYGFGCVLCSVFFVPGLAWIRIVNWLDERQAKRQNLKKPKPKSV